MESYNEKRKLSLCYERNVKGSYIDEEVCCISHE
jgi:hypothetical protein